MLTGQATAWPVVVGAILTVVFLAFTVVTGAPETVIDVLDPAGVDTDLGPIPTIADVAGSLPVVAVAVAVIALASRSWRAATAVVAVATLAELLTAGIKLIVDRPRPSALSTSEFVGSASFPSGHVVRTAVAVGLALVILPWARRHPAAGLALGAAVVVGMAVGRVAAGAHHTSDVIAGMLVAAGMLAGVALVGSSGAARRMRRVVPVAIAIVAAPLGAGAVQAASPTPAVGGDPRVPEGGASLIGEPVVAIVGTLVVGIAAALVTWLYVRLTPDRGTDVSSGHQDVGRD